MAFEVNGKLIKKFDTESKTDSFQAREFVIEIESGKYPQFIKFQLVQDRCALVDDYAEGDMIKVFFDLRGREWNEKYFTNLNAWKIEKAAETAGESVAAATGGDNFPSADDAPSTEAAADDDLPF